MNIGVDRYNNMFKQDGWISTAAARELYDAADLFGYWDCHPDCAQMDSTAIKTFAHNYARYRYQEGKEVNDRVPITYAYIELEAAIKAGKHAPFSLSEPLIPADKIMGYIYSNLREKIERDRSEYRETIVNTPSMER